MDLDPGMRKDRFQENIKIEKMNIHFPNKIFRWIGFL